MSAFSVDTGRQTPPPLVDGVVHNRLVQFAPHRRCAHKSGDVINFIIVACRISSLLKWYKNYKNRLRLSKVIVKNKMSRFLWFTVYSLQAIETKKPHILRTQTFQWTYCKCIKFPDNVDFSSLSRFKRSIHKVNFSTFLKCFSCTFIILSYILCIL